MPHATLAVRNSFASNDAIEQQHNSGVMRSLVGRRGSSESGLAEVSTSTKQLEDETLQSIAMEDAGLAS